MEIARAADSQIIHKPMDLSRVVETNGPGWTGSLTTSTRCSVSSGHQRHALAAPRIPAWIIADANDGVFLAEKLVNKLLPRLKHEAALKEIYLERHAE